jgi:hypothetical protein
VVYKKLNSTGTLIQRNNHGRSSIGLDVHEKTISYRAKDASGQDHREARLGRPAGNWTIG